jgi:hypothetical protein
MKKSDLKQLIKPLVKECIHEVLLEEGLLSNVVAEVVKGMQTSMITENVAPTPAVRTAEMHKKSNTDRKKISEQRKKMMDAIGKDAYNGVNLFEGSEPIAAPHTDPQQGAVDMGSPSDAGVDISSLVGGASRLWDAMK